MWQEKAGHRGWGFTLELKESEQSTVWSQDATEPHCIPLEDKCP